MDNKYNNPNYDCKGCIYEDEEPTHHICSICCRNNLSGLYLDFHVTSIEEGK